MGPVIEPDEGAALFRLLRSRLWARHLGPMAHDRMPQLLERADVILNCSLSEGGMANSVLEALAMGRAVLAADIGWCQGFAGNRGPNPASCRDARLVGPIHASAHASAPRTLLPRCPAIRGVLERSRARVSPSARTIECAQDHSI